MNLKGSVMPKSGLALLAAGLSATVIATGTTGAATAAPAVAAVPAPTIGFGTPSATYGQRVTARLTVAPGNDLRSTLQRWDGEKWVSIKWVYLKKGAGAYTFTATQRGLNAYRFVVPSSTYAGRAIATTITSKFYLAVR